MHIFEQGKLDSTIAVAELRKLRHKFGAQFLEWKAKEPYGGLNRRNINSKPKCLPSTCVITWMRLLLHIAGVARPKFVATRRHFRPSRRQSNTRIEEENTATRGFRRAGYPQQRESRRNGPEWEHSLDFRVSKPLPETSRVRNPETEEDGDLRPDRLKIETRNGGRSRKSSFCLAEWPRVLLLLSLCSRRERGRESRRWMMMVMMLPSARKKLREDRNCAHEGAAARIKLAVSAGRDKKMIARS